MRVAGHFLIALATACSPIGADEAGQAVDVHWPSFRGEHAAGVAEGCALPARWSVQSGAGIRWIAAVPGLGHSSPVVWNGWIFLTTAVGPDEPVLRVHKGEEHARRPYGWIQPLRDEGAHEFRVLCIRARDGRLEWSRTAHRGTPFSKRHPAGTHANPTVAVDARHVVAYFGAEGLHAYDHDGNLLWSRDLGELVGGYYVNPEVQWGIASSPVLHRDRVLLLCDVLDEPFLAALDVETGDELWRTARYDVPTWGTPTVVERGAQTQVVVNGFESIAGYDFESGEQVWSMSGGGGVPIPTPVAAHDLLFVTSAGGVPGGRGGAALRAPIYAIRADARGVVTVDNHVEWYRPTGGNYMSTPLVYGDELYCATSSVLTCYDARTGREHYRERLGAPITGFAASPVGGDGKVYLTKDDGTVHVLACGPRLEVLAVNELEEACMATPAIAAGALFFRTPSRLIAVGVPQP